MPKDGINYPEHLTEADENYGIELEITKVNRENPNFKQEFSRLFKNWKRVHDGSCETPILSINNIPIEFNEKNQKDKDMLMPLFKDSQILLGGEIVSPILSTKDDFNTVIYKLCDLLWKYGENSLSGNVRDSLHIHINVGKTIPFFKIINLLKLHSAYEAILYRLGGMGTTNRGDFTDYIFMRPFLGNSAPVVNFDGNKYPIFNYKDLLNAKDKEEFFIKFGDTTYYSRDKTRYVTQRYVGLNFYSIPIYGTIEFRHANKTLVPEWIISWLNLCIAFVKVCNDKNLDINIERPLYENRVIPDDEFINSLDIFNLSSEDRVNLIDIWNRSPTPKYDNLWRYSHLPNPTFFSGRYSTKPITEKVYKPHNIHYREVQEKLNNDIRIAVENNEVNEEFENEFDNLPRKRLFGNARRERIKRNWTIITPDNHQGIILSFIDSIENNKQRLWTLPEHTIILGIIYKNLEITIIYEENPEVKIYLKHKDYDDIFRYIQVLEKGKDVRNPIIIHNYLPRITETIERANRESNFFFVELVNHNDYNGNELKDNNLYLDFQMEQMLKADWLLNNDDEEENEEDEII